MVILNHPHLNPVFQSTVFPQQIKPQVLMMARQTIHWKPRVRLQIKIDPRLVRMTEKKSKNHHLCKTPTSRKFPFNRTNSVIHLNSMMAISLTTLKITK